MHLRLVMFSITIAPTSPAPSLLTRSVFLLMIRRPPRSTPFPTRRSSDLTSRRSGRRCSGSRAPDRSPRCTTHRSEEHTSELQSHHDLVCRLLLEKKKHRTRMDMPLVDSLIVRVRV